MIQAVHAGLEARFEEVPDPFDLKVGRAVWRVTSRSTCAFGAFFRRSYYEKRWVQEWTDFFVHYGMVIVGAHGVHWLMEVTR